MITEASSKTIFYAMRLVYGTDCRFNGCNSEYGCDMPNCDCKNENCMCYRVSKERPVR